LVSDYKNAFALIRRDPHFSADEIAHMSDVYSGILNQSVKNVNELGLVIKALLTQMDDGDRLYIIDAAADRIDQNYSDLHLYTQENILLSMQRAKDQADLNAIRSLYDR
jgi:predicted transcriptional regulator